MIREEGAATPSSLSHYNCLFVYIKYYSGRLRHSRKNFPNILIPGKMAGEV